MDTFYLERLKELTEQLPEDRLMDALPIIEGYLKLQGVELSVEHFLMYDAVLTDKTRMYQTIADSLMLSRFGEKQGLEHLLSEQFNDQYWPDRKKLKASTALALRPAAKIIPFTLANHDAPAAGTLPTAEHAASVMPVYDLATQPIAALPAHQGIVAVPKTDETQSETMRDQDASTVAIEPYPILYHSRANAAQPAPSRKGRARGKLMLMAGTLALTLLPNTFGSATMGTTTPDLAPAAAIYLAPEPAPDPFRMVSASLASEYRLPEADVHHFLSTGGSPSDLELALNEDTRTLHSKRKELRTRMGVDNGESLAEVIAYKQWINQARARDIGTMPAYPDFGQNPSQEEVRIWLKDAIKVMHVEGKRYRAMVSVESSRMQYAQDGSTLTSSKGAIGLAQIIPEYHPELDERRLRNEAAYNLFSGAAVFRKMWTSQGRDWDAAVRFYNGGSKPGYEEARIAYLGKVKERMD